MVEEVWKEVYAFDAFEVSNLGQIRSKEPGFPVVKSKIDLRGYVTVCFYGYTMAVHTIVLETFVSPRPKGLVCCHWDGNKENNKLSNLRWDINKANGEDTARHNREKRALEQNENT